MDNINNTHDSDHASSGEVQRLYQQSNCLVLLIDDQELVAYSLRKILEPEEDISFHYCSDPRDAVRMAAEIKPTVIFLDLLMPVLDGMSVLHSMRSHTDLKEIPIVVLSSEEEAELKAEAFAHGANDYITKWPEPIELLARLRYHSRWYINLKERDEALQALRTSQRLLAEKNLQLEHMTQVDGLTGIYNRRFFDARLHEELRRSIRNRNTIAVMMADVDHFKLYNDHYGHLAGDECLKRVADIINMSMRRPADLCARYGGEEFSIVLPDITYEGAITVAERICQQISDSGISHEASPVMPHVTISIGTCILQPEQGTQPETLINHADKALYQAKQDGRNRIVVTTGLME
ncbi:MAG: diguanylate cyclase [Sedimenticola sp.]